MSKIYVMDYIHSYTDEPRVNTTLFTAVSTPLVASPPRRPPAPPLPDPLLGVNSHYPGRVRDKVFHLLPEDDRRQICLALDLDIFEAADALWKYLSFGERWRIRQRLRREQ